MRFHKNVREVLDRTKGKKVGLFIDNANWFYPQKELGWRISYHFLHRFLLDHYMLPVTRLYAGTPLTKAHKATFERFCKAVEYEGIEVFTKPLKKIWVDRKQGNFEYKCNFDVEIALDVATSLYRNEVDIVMIGSGDSDFLAVKDFTFSMKKGFISLCFEKGVAWEMRKGYHIFLEDLRPVIEHL